MIFLYNKERVILEGLELVKLKVSQRLARGINIVEGGFIIKDGKLVPDFRIDMDKVDKKVRPDVGDILRDEWNAGLFIINERLSNL